MAQAVCGSGEGGWLEAGRASERVELAARSGVVRRGKIITNS